MITDYMTKISNFVEEYDVNLQVKNQNGKFCFLLTSSYGEDKAPTILAEGPTMVEAAQALCIKIDNYEKGVSNGN